MTGKNNYSFFSEFLHNLVKSLNLITHYTYLKWDVFNEELRSNALNNSFILTHELVIKFPFEIISLLTVETGFRNSSKMNKSDLIN